MNVSKRLRSELDYILNQANFTADEEIIFRMLAKGKSRQEISMKIKVSIPTVDRKIKSIKDKMERIEGDDMAKEVPIWEKACLTIEEAAAYSNIGQDRLRDIAKDTTCSFILKVGTKTLIKREQFEDYLKNVNAI